MAAQGRLKASPHASRSSARGCDRPGRSAAEPRPLRVPVRRKAADQVLQLQLGGLPPIQDHLDQVRSETRELQDPRQIGQRNLLGGGQLGQVRVSSALEHPLPPERPRQALTIALSTRGRGAHGAPSGVTTVFRPPRFLNVIGIWIVIVSPSAETVARLFMLPPACCPRPPAPARRARSAAAGPRRRASVYRPARPAAARSAPARRGRARPTAGQAAAAPPGPLPR